LESPRRADPRLSAFLPGRWERLARAVDLAPEAPVLVALSGGADSVFLLQLAARARSRPPIRAVHVEHGLRGAAGESDLEFCRALCAELRVPFHAERLSLDKAAPGLEARARVARYRALCRAAANSGVVPVLPVPTVLTGHHADDALETLLMRWMRGTRLAGLGALPARTHLAPRSETREFLTSRFEVLNTTETAIDLVRPLLAMRREEVRASLREHGFVWREDATNGSPAFARNRVRHALLPEIEATCGEEALDHLRAFGAAVEELEERLATLTARLAWSPPLFAAARRSARDLYIGGTLARATLMALASPLRRRALWRLLTEGTGHPPSRAVLALVLMDLESGRTARHSLPGGWSLALRADLLHLEPAPRMLLSTSTDDESTPSTAAQLSLPFHERTEQPASAAHGWLLSVPGIVHLGDGRAIAAHVEDTDPDIEPLHSPASVELDATGLVDEAGRPLVPLRVRWPRSGDRFRPLGAPGSRRLCRFLADCGVPREDRGRIPLIVAADAIVWVAGIRPCESRRVTRTTRQRLVLSLQHAADDARAERERRSPLFDGVPVG
jgi:tRNA(Ile)-lysidine synthase